MIDDLKFRWNAYANIPGYAILEHENFLALKSPHRVPWHNMVYAFNPVNEADWQGIKEFFGDFPIRYYNPLEFQEGSSAFLAEKGFKETEKIWEMAFNRNTQALPSSPEKVSLRVEHVRSIETIPKWLQVAADAFRIPEHLRIDIATPIFKHCSDSHDFFIAYQGDEPIGTCFTCTDSKTKTTGLYAVSIAEDHRKQGLAKAMVQGVMSSEPVVDSEQVTLRACDIGLKLYDGLRFKQGDGFMQYD